MDDINRPLRRLEIAQRIQELRRRAAEESRPPAPADVAPLRTTAGPAAQPAAAPAGGPVAAPAGGPVAAPAGEPVHRPFDEQGDDSAAATIATLLRGGQTWILDQG